MGMASTTPSPENNRDEGSTIEFLFLFIGVLLIVLSASPMTAAGIFVMFMAIILNNDRRIKKMSKNDAKDKNSNDF